MPSEPVPRIYWDSCIFLSIIEDNPERMPILNPILDALNAGKVEIYTSQLSITEVAYASSERSKNKLDDATLEKIDALWNPSAPFKLVEVHDFVTGRARNLIRCTVEAGMSGLRSADAIHLATAMLMDADRLETYDEKLMKFQELEPITFSVKIPTDLHQPEGGLFEQTVQETRP